MSDTKEILIVCASDTLVHLLYPVGRELLKAGYLVKYSTLMYSRERAEFELAKVVTLEEYVGVVEPSRNWLSNYSAIIVGNDWGDEIRSVIYLSEFMHIPVFCIQESVIDFSGPKRRLCHAKYVLLQGDISRKMIKRYDNIFVGGNPRYDSIERKPLPKYLKAFVNVNFTYGIEEENRESWIRDVIWSCNLAKISVTLVQHPRDKSDLSIFNVEHVKSSAAVVHQILSESTFVITRFSSIIHEAICTGRATVYFNPFSENVYYDFGPDGRVLYYADNKFQLVDCLNSMVVNPPTNNEMDNYISKHLYLHGSSAVNCANIVKNILNNKYAFNRFNLFNPLFYYFRLKAILKDLYRFIRKF